MKNIQGNQLNSKKIYHSHWQGKCAKIILKILFILSFTKKIYFSLVYPSKSEVQQFHFFLFYFIFFMFTALCNSPTHYILSRCVYMCICMVHYLVLNYKTSLLASNKKNHQKPSSIFSWNGWTYYILPHLNKFKDIGVLTKSPFQRRKNRSLLKKQVKFTDDLKCTPDILTTIVKDNKDECEKISLHCNYNHDDEDDDDDDHHVTKHEDKGNWTDKW